MGEPAAVPTERDPAPRSGPWPNVPRRAGWWCAPIPRATHQCGDKGKRALGAEWGGVSIDIHHHSPSTVFVALHEPYQNAVPNQSRFRRIQQTADGIAAAISGKTSDSREFDDRLLVQFDRRAEAALNPDFPDDFLILAEPTRV